MALMDRVRRVFARMLAPLYLVRVFVALLALEGNGDGGDGGDPKGDPKKDGDPADDPKKDDPAGDPKGDPKKDDQPDPDDLGDAGKRAIAAERQARKEAERKAKDAADELERIRRENETEQEKKTREAVDAARKEERERSDERIVKAEVKARAGTKLNDPEDAVRFVALGDFKVDDDGNVDTKAIDKAIDELLKDKPYLATKGGKPTGSGDGGARKGGGDKPDVSPGLGRLKSAYADSSKT